MTTMQISNSDTTLNISIVQDKNKIKYNKKRIFFLLLKGYIIIVLMGLVISAITINFTQTPAFNVEVNPPLKDMNVIDKSMKPTTEVVAETEYRTKPIQLSVTDAINCTIDNDCNHGVCNNNICDCNDGYTTGDDRRPCNKRGPTQLGALLFQIFLLNGPAHLYVGQITNGVLLLIFVGYGVIVLLCIVLCICAGIGVALEGKEGVACFRCFRYLLGLTIGAVWIAYLIIIAQNNLKDGDGNKLVPL